MPKKAAGVYPDGRGGWYLKVWTEPDPLTGKRRQITKRGFRTAGEAAEARRRLVEDVADGRIQTNSAGITVNELLDLYLDGIDADGRLSVKTRFDYRTVSGFSSHRLPERRSAA